MIRYFFLCLLLLTLGVIIQQWSPSLGDGLFDARVLVVPLFYFCIAHAQPYIPTLIFAIIAGFFWDMENVIAPFFPTTERVVASVDNLRFGYSIFLFGMAGFTIKFIQANFRYYGMLIYLITIFLIFFFYLLMENLFILFVRGTGTVDHRFLYQILLTSLFSTLFAPLILLVLVGLWKILKLREKGLIFGLKEVIRRKY